MVWIAIAAAAALLLLLVAVRLRPARNAEPEELSAYHDGLDALDRLSSRREAGGASSPPSRAVAGTQSRSSGVDGARP
ncbi:MAG: hypothetical protein U5R31_01390 [Acidimicrobiia bacterium]|nr:hypothetical protein [Acidimicrobiia bacterium]